jgi:hypothetical protein
MSGGHRKALEEIAIRAVRIRENKAVVGVEATFIERIAKEALSKVEPAASVVEYVNLLFDKQLSRGPFDMYFIEAEDADGKGINVGCWVPRGGSRWALVIPWVRTAVASEEELISFGRKP